MKVLLIFTLLKVSTSSLFKYNKGLKAERQLTDPIAFCGDGICSLGENCLTCPSDCISGTSGGNECGNGLCEDSENCYTCPEDCNSDILSDSEDLFCCYGGPNDPEVLHSVACDEDIRCGLRNGRCTIKASPIVNFCCGDLSCDGDETESNCSVDNCSSMCGNGICDILEGENTDSCRMDCKCNLDGVCNEQETFNSCPLDCTCGNFVCNYDVGETVVSCPHDCGCNANGMCDPWEDAKNCPMDNCFNYPEYNENEQIEDSDSSCKDNNDSCESHSDCCSFACDIYGSFVCVS